MTSLLGIDLAWKGCNNTTAASIAAINRNTIHIEEVHSSITNWSNIINIINKIQLIMGIAIDAPLIVINLSGQRSCEIELSRKYGARGASCHATNLTLYPNPDSVNLSQELMKYDFEHLNRNGKFQIECYLHPALIEIFALPERLQYKKGKINVRRLGQCKLSELIRSLERSSVLRLTLSKETQQLLNQEYILSLRGQALKQNEDALDSIICAYIAGLFYVGSDFNVFGSISDGYIFVPKVKCI
ncbi:MAG: DUF429 domain-containing protein [Deltaproteobacteria bacterium]|nr:DUF429 domain-containing protein [Deltaproteobacteria bacterium]